MKPLIRLLLLMVVRLALFLVVVAWLAGQWWGVICSGTVKLIPVQIILCDRGIAAALRTTGSVEWQYTVVPPQDVAEGRWVFEPGKRDLLRFSDSRVLPGFTFLTDGVVTIISVRHWLMTGILASVFMALEFLFRKRQPRRTDTTNRDEETRNQ